MSMNQKNLARFRALFEKQKTDILNHHRLMDSEFQVQKDELMDETDLTSFELEQSMRIRLRNRESLYLKKIDGAIERIRDGTFGTCVECDEEIGIRRLEARPTTTVCVNCKEALEHIEQTHADGRKRKSIGRGISLKLA